MIPRRRTSAKRNIHRLALIKTFRAFAVPAKFPDEIVARPRRWRAFRKPRVVGCINLMQIRHERFHRDVAKKENAAQQSQVYPARLKNAPTRADTMACQRQIVRARARGKSDPLFRIRISFDAPPCIQSFQPARAMI